MAIRVRKAIIPAAGIGTRFLPVTKALPKEMLPIVDTPAIQFIVEEAIASGIESILIVTNGSKRMIEDYFDRSIALEMVLADQGKHASRKLVRDIADIANIHFIRQQVPLGLGHAILCARQFVDDEPFAVLLPDELIVGTPPALKGLMDVHAKFGTSVVGVQAVPDEDVDKYGIIAPGGPAVFRDERVQAIADIIEKPSVKDAPSNQAVIGRYVLEPDIFHVLESLSTGKNGEIQLTDALRVINQKERMMALEVRGWRYDLGNRLGYVQAVLDFSLRRKELRDGMLDYLERQLAGAIPNPMRSTLMQKERDA